MSRISVIITLMLTAMLALVAFQWYWIDNSIKEKREQFEQKINDVLLKTAQKIEKQEVVFLAKQKLALLEKQKLLKIANNKQNPVRAKSTTMNFVKQENGYITIEPKQILSLEYGRENEPKTDALNDNLIIFPEKQSEYIKQFMNSNYISSELFFEAYKDVLGKKNNADELMEIIDNDPYFSYEAGQKEFLTEDTLKIKAKSKHEVEIVKDVFKEYLLGKRSIFERVNQIMIDTLLKKELENAGFTLPFEYVVKEKEKSIFASFTPKQYFNQKYYKVKLFNDSSIDQNQTLEIFFPDKETYILRNIWSVLASSVLLLCLIGGVFFYSVNTLMSQKKLAAIKNDFINNMTHELKTPVSTISLALEIINDKNLKNTPEKTERYLNIINQENQRLGTQIEKVLNLAKLEKGNVELHVESLDLLEIIPIVLKNLSVQLEAKNAEIKFFNHKGEYWVLGDRVHLTNIVFNLIDNAIKYSGDSPIIQISLRNVADEVELSIKDNGIGIAKEHFNKIFDKFYRVSQGDLHDTKGYGLGLSYVKHLLALHGGTIRVESSPGIGTEFIVLLKS
jgi:two-component system, OmpR family, phosphate regulon sensor histidine kinase PhoR